MFYHDQYLYLYRPGMLWKGSTAGNDVFLHTYTLHIIAIFFFSCIFQHLRHICAPLTTARAPVYLTRKLPSSCLTYLLYCHHQIFICKGEDLWMVAFLCFTHTPSVFWGEFHTISLHIYRVLHVITWVSLKKKKKDWVLATINFPTPGGGGVLGVTLLKIDWKPQGGSDVARTFFWCLVHQPEKQWNTGCTSEV